MLNASSPSPEYCDAMFHRGAKRGGRKHAAKQQSFKKRYFPFHHLPREIIAEIFVLCLPDFEDIFYAIKSKQAAPLLLCNVSSSWRSLALSIPRLWNELSIRVADPQVDIDLATDMTNSWIARSGGLPLSLRLHATPWNETGQGVDMVKAQLNIFCRYASRWEYVVIGLFGCSAVSLPMFGPTPLLRRFSHSTSSPIAIPFPFTSCPLLSSFTWPFSCFIGSSRDTNIPWHQLTHITLEHMSTHQALEILQTCKMLVHFRVEIGDDLSYDPVRPRRKPVENRSLRSFQISVYQTCSGLLRSLTLPVLTDLSLDIDYDNLRFISPLSVRAQLLGLFTRSKCKLERLRLGNCGFNDACILQCLDHNSCSSLTELDISNDFNRPMFTDIVILALTDKEDLSEVNDVLLPNLSRLSLDLCLSASPGLLGLMILRRCLWWDNVDQLKFLALVVRHPLNDVDSMLLEFARETGLDVQIAIDQYNDSDESEFTEDLYDTDDTDDS